MTSLATRSERDLSRFVVHPYYTGRDKGALRDTSANSVHDGRPLLFDTPGDAWWHVFFVAQPNDPRAKHNYRVVTLREYREAV